MHVVGKVEVYESLKHQGGSTKSKKHYCQFKQPKRGDKGGFPFITIFDPDVVIAPSHVKLSKNGELVEIIDEFRDER